MKVRIHCDEFSSDRYHSKGVGRTCREQNTLESTQAKWQNNSKREFNRLAKRETIYWGMKAKLISRQKVIRIVFVTARRLPPALLKMDFLPRLAAEMETWKSSINCLASGDIVLVNRPVGYIL
jgi:hypothetical protein